MKRNLIVPGGKVESMSLDVNGAGFTRLVRSLWEDGGHLQAIALLMEGLKGLNWETAKAILEGRMKLVGDGATLMAEPDTYSGITYEAAVAKEKKPEPPAPDETFYANMPARNYPENYNSYNTNP